LCIESERRCKMKTHPVIDVAQLLRNKGHFPENQFDESEKSTR
jgi:hypothetical protein